MRDTTTRRELLAAKADAEQWQQCFEEENDKVRRASAELAEMQTAVGVMRDHVRKLEERARQYKRKRDEAWETMFRLNDD
jgi:chromosome segregation ATPase